ncbi:hypothetical protein CEXT_729081 [Caerostris extrusa]|uniref:Uncharacterized protein n=1 Tax=Caerostris extrusa TaxID=172846 RepID=A0AAV4PI60_CAEEX|nr:hypothetical protein CEXT_729081 [Caerostris extrusa]
MGFLRLMKTKKSLINYCEQVLNERGDPLRKTISEGCRTVAKRRRHTNLKQKGSSDAIGLGADDFFFCVREEDEDSDLGRIRHALGKDKGTFETVRRLRKQSVPQRKRTCCPLLLRCLSTGALG